MKHLYYILLSVASLLFITFSCIDDPDMDTSLQNGKAPAVSETSQVSITASSLILKASLLKQNGSEIIEYGFCWSDQKDANPKDNIRNNRKVKATNMSDKTFESTISNLTNNTTYYVYAYAINQTDTACSENAGVYTTNVGVGEVKTLKPDCIKATSALVKGLISNKGEGSILEIGFYLSAKPGNNEPSRKDSTVRYTPNGLDINSIDTFSIRIVSLKPLTKYYVRAYALNSFGEFSFSVDSFITTDGKPKIESLTINNIGYYSATATAALSSAGDASLSDYGFCISKTNTPGIGESGTVKVAGGTITDNKFAATLSSLEAARKYYIVAYATNEFGTTYSSEVKSFSTLNTSPTITTSSINTSLIKNGTAVVGGELISGGEYPATEWGICWATSKSGLDLTNVIKAETAIFNCTLTDLKGGTTYYVCAYAKNQHGLIGYGDTLSFKTPNTFTIKNIYSSPRAFSAAFAIDNQAYIVGGDMGNKCTNELLSYIPSSDQWVSLAPYKAAYSNSTACASGTNIYVIGGTDKQSAVGDFTRYDYNSNSWNNTLQSIPTARYNAISFAFKDSIYFVGGQNNSESNSKEIFVYDKSSGTWKASANSFPAAMRYGFAVVANNVVFAGLGEASQKALWHSSDLITWTVIDNLPSSIGTVLSGVYDSARNSIFMIDNNSKIWEYELSADKWISHSAFPYTEKNYHMFVLNGNIYILGQHMYNTNYLMVYDPEWDN